MPMNPSLFLLTVVIALAAVSGSASEQQRVNTLEDALAIARLQFVGQDVDYYRLDDGNDDQWTIFIDAEPLAGWAHPCYLLRDPKCPEVGDSREYVAERAKYDFPPCGRYEDLLVKDRYGAMASIKPRIRRKSIPSDAGEAEAQLSCAERTYAVILSGGGNPFSNYERYWNDCSFIYQTLVNRYGVPREHIIPIMSDGNYPADDMKSIGGSYCSQDLDLDGDGTDDIELAATKENIVNTFGHLASVMRPGDHLFLYVMDHGTQAKGDKLLDPSIPIPNDDDSIKSVICLWNLDGKNDLERHEWMDPFELAKLLEPFCDNSINVNVVMGQCFSGGFVEPLSMKGCVIETASDANETSKAFQHQSPPYDSFVYYWTSAINGADPYGNTADADADGNGRITMDEAFAYAKGKDKVNDKIQEHPQYRSTPASLGEELAFDHIPPSVDLYIKDNPEDTGKTPNTTCDIFWTSPSIWVRNQPDGIGEHQNPVFSESHPANTVYVRIHNRGKDDYTGNDKSVRVHWAYASTGYRPEVWAGNEKNASGNPTGGLVASVPVPAIPSGEYRDVAVGWSMPADTDMDLSDIGDFSLLAEIVDSCYVYARPSFSGYDIRQSNNTAMKSVRLVSRDELNYELNAYVRNVRPFEERYTLELKQKQDEECPFYIYGDVDVILDDEACHIDGASTGEFSDGSIYLDNTGYFEYPTESGSIHVLCLEPGRLGDLGLKFKFRSAPALPSSCTLDLIQKMSDTGEIVGGFTYKVQLPIDKGIALPVEPDPLPGGEIVLAAETEEDAAARWEDPSGKTIGNGDSVIVRRSIGEDRRYSIYSLDEDGVLATGGYTVERAKIILSVERVGNRLVVRLSDVLPGGCTVAVVSSASGTMVYNHKIRPEEPTLEIDLSTWRADIFAISAFVDGREVQSMKFEKK